MGSKAAVGLLLVVGHFSSRVALPAVPALPSGGEACLGAQYIISSSGNFSVNGCYQQHGSYGDSPLYLQQASSLALQELDPPLTTTQPFSIFRYEFRWYIGIPGVVALYSAGCETELPPSNWSVYSSTGGTHTPVVTFGNHSELAPCPHAYEMCTTCPACQALWGQKYNGSCPDLHLVEPDLVRPPMLTNGTLPGPGRRVKVVESSFNGTQAYHALYLPTDWQPQESRPAGTTYPVIVEYMGNGFVRILRNLVHNGCTLYIHCVGCLSLSLVLCKRLAKS